MLKTIQTKVLIKYAQLQPFGQYVALDSASGGYPYGTTIERAHDFKTVEAADSYREHFDGLIVIEVEATYVEQDA